MQARIPDGYSRHVGVGDGITTPEVEFRYRPVRGPEIQDHIIALAKADDPSKVQSEAVADRVEFWQCDGFDSVRPTVKELAELDGYAYRDLYDVIFNGKAPKKVYDRDAPKDDADQMEDDAGNSPEA